jgi:hypothetical protein
MGVQNSIVLSAFLVGISLFLPSGFIHAYVPVLVFPQDVGDVISVEDPEVMHAFYGSMIGFPHTFEIRADEPFTLHTQIWVPDMKRDVHAVSGIIIKEQSRGGRVIEVTRMSAKDASWDSKFESFSGDRYHHGPTFDAELEPGVYRIEVHTPDNTTCWRKRFFR